MGTPQDLRDHSPPNWKLIEGKERKDPYFYNKKTKESIWEIPEFTMDSIITKNYVIFERSLESLGGKWKIATIL